LLVDRDVNEHPYDEKRRLENEQERRYQDRMQPGVRVLTDLGAGRVEHVSWPWRWVRLDDGPEAWFQFHGATLAID
jgi:hypothetical protein